MLPLRPKSQAGGKGDFWVGMDLEHRQREMGAHWSPPQVPASLMTGRAETRRSTKISRAV